jgi:hypothetical protein
MLKMTVKVKTNSKVFRAEVRKHVIDCLSTDYTEVLEEQLSNVVEDFHNWYGPYEQKRNRNVYEAFKDWLMGLPSSLSVEYEYYRFTEVLKAWFEACGAEYREQDSEKEYQLYMHLVTSEFEKLCKENNIEFIR